MGMGMGMGDRGIGGWGDRDRDRGMIRTDLDARRAVVCVRGAPPTRSSPRDLPPMLGGGGVGQGSRFDERGRSAPAGAPLPGPPPQTARGRENASPDLRSAPEFSPLREERAGRGRGRGPRRTPVRCTSPCLELRPTGCGRADARGRRTGPGRRVRAGGLCAVVAANSFAPERSGRTATIDPHRPVRIVRIRFVRSASPESVSSDPHRPNRVV
jgi:hypothetical protein